MNKIIGGRKYDTDTAELIGSISLYPPDDPKHYNETLYRKQTGEYFLHAEGNALSKYAEKCIQTQYSSGEIIIPYAEDAAKMWAERNLNTSTYENLFGEVNE